MSDKQLEEKRLIEITSEICKTDDLLWTMGYISTLDRGDIDLLFREIDLYTSKNAMSFYDSLVSFSKNYLKQRGIVIEPQVANFPSYFGKNYEGGVSYFERMMATDNLTKKSK